MIFLISDLHGKLDFDGWQEYQNRQEDGDILILLGDVRLNEPEVPDNDAFTKAILSTQKQVLLVDGNHENFDFLNGCPEEDWCGGKVHRLAENVRHLQRGHLYTIQGKKIFVFGGTAPHITQEELEWGYETLKNCDNRVDYILTHDYYTRRDPANIKPFEAFIDYIDTNVEFTQWYCGHHHKNQSWDAKHTIVYDLLKEI